MTEERKKGRRKGNKAKQSSHEAGNISPPKTVSLFQKIISKIYDSKHKLQTDLWPLKWIAFAFILIDFHWLNHHPLLQIDHITIVEFLYFIYVLRNTILFRKKLSAESQIINLFFDFLIFSTFLILAFTTFFYTTRIYLLYLIPIIYCSYWFHWAFTLVFTFLTSTAYALLNYTILLSNMDTLFINIEIEDTWLPVVGLFWLFALMAIFFKKIILNYFVIIDRELHKRAEKLEQEREYTHTLLKDKIDGFIAIDKKGNITATNRLAWELLGYSENEINRQSVKNLYAPSEASRIMKLLRQSPDGTIENEKTIMLSRDKEKIPIMLSAAFLYDRKLNLQEELAKEEKFSSLGYFRDIRAEEIFYSIAKEITLIAKEKELLDKIVDRVATTLKAETCGVLIYDDGKDRLEIISAHGMPKVLWDKGNKKVEHYREMEGLTGKVFSLEKTLNIPDINVNKKEPAHLDIKWTYAERYAEHSRFRDFKHFLGTPLNIHGEIFGVLRVLNKYSSENKLDDKGFSDKDQLLLERIASQVSILLENVRNRERFEAISNIGRELNEKFDVSLDELLQAISRQVVTGMKYKACYLRLIENGNRLRIRACFGLKDNYQDEKYTIPFGVGITGKVAKTGKAYIREDLKKEKKYFFKEIPEKEKLSSLLSLPLKYRGRVIGVINCYTGRKHTFTDQEIQITETFANYAAVAIQNKKRVDELMALNEIGRELVKPFELDKLFNLILQKAKAISGADRLCIKIYDAGKKEIKTPCARNCEWYKIHKSKVRKLGDDFVSRAIKDEEIKIIPHYNINLDKLGNVPQKELFADTKSCVVVPIKIYGKVFGVFCLESKVDDFFTKDDSLSLSAFSIKAAIAIRNANFLKKLQAVTETFPNISELDTDLDKVLNNIAEKALNVLESDILVLYRFDHKNQKIIWPPIYAGKIYHPEYMTTPVKFHQAPLLIINQGETHYASDARNDLIMTPPKQKEEQDTSERFVHREKIVSSAGIILKVSQEIVGVMFINYRTPYDFNTDGRQLIEIFASYIAIAMQNVMHFKATKIAHTMQTIGKIAANFAHNIKNDLGTISLYTGDLMDDTDPESLQYFPLSQIKERISKITTEINFLLTASKASAHKKSSTSIRKLINNFKSELAADLSDKNIKFNTKIPSRLPKIEIDPYQIKMVLVNLAQNSFDAMPEGGKIFLSISEIENHLLLKWMDSGCGISQENAHEVFDILWTTKDKGYGLGLFFTKAIIEEHGGSISLDLDYRQGTRFLVTLPIQRPKKS